MLRSLLCRSPGVRPPVPSLLRSPVAATLGVRAPASALARLCSSSAALTPAPAAPPLGPPSRFAVIALGGTQYKVAPDDLICVEKIEAAVGSTIETKRVLLVGEADATVIGSPVIEDAVPTRTLPHATRTPHAPAFPPPYFPRMHTGCFVAYPGGHTRLSHRAEGRHPLPALLSRGRADYPEWTIYACHMCTCTQPCQHGPLRTLGYSSHHAACLLAPLPRVPQCVRLTVEEQGYGKKVIAFKKKKRKGYRRWKGYRARLTLLRISAIECAVLDR